MTSARPLNVLTYNIHHGRGVDGVLDLERIAATIDESGADLVGLQEVDNHWGARSDWKDQPAWFAWRLGMHVAYAANLDLPPLNSGEAPRQYGNAILSRFPIIDFQNTFLPKYPRREQRGLLEATIEVRGNDLSFADTHLTANNDVERLDQAERVVELLGASELPTVLVGDFNARPETPAIARLTAHWRDTWTEVGIGPGYTVTSANPAARIDYVLHGDHLLARAAAVISTRGSDHLPVLAQLSLL